MSKLQTDDYVATKTELRERVMMMYTHNMGLITITLAAWTAVATIMSITIKDGSPLYEIIYPLIYCLFFIPALLAVPLSVKSGDNLTRVAQLAAYIRVFHELKNLVSYKKGDNICLYESAFKPIGHGKRIKHFNREFPFIVTLSILAISLFMIAGLFVLNYEKNTAIYIVSPILAGILLIALIFILIFVAKNSSTEWNFSKQRENSENEYIEIAKLIGVITEDDEKKYREYLKTASKTVSDHRVNEYVKNNIDKLRKKF